MAQIIEMGLAKLNIKYSNSQLNLLNKYIKLLLKWNKVYSLTAITNPDQMKVLHILDGAGIVPFMPEIGRVLDVGSGMGVPGVIIAILCPGLKVTLIDSNAKKVAFLRQVKIELNLVNLEIIHKRVEDFQPADNYHIITSRAFADLKLFVDLTRHLLVLGGYYLAMKSQHASIEVTHIEDYCSELINVRIPYLDAPRVLVKMYQL